MTTESVVKEEESYRVFSIFERVERLPFDGWKALLRPIARHHGAKVDAGIAEHFRVFGDELPAYPPPSTVLRAFQFFDVPDTRVVIIGQDCYPSPGQATGLCFGVPRDTPCLPPSLRNVFKELEREYGVQRTDGDLSDWAQQGVLLLNTALTVRCGAAGSHMKHWVDFTTAVVQQIAANTRGVVFLLWGAHAAAYENVISAAAATRRSKDNNGHLVLVHSHPSPLSRRPFTGCDHFRAANDFLERVADKPPIRWC